MFKFSLISTLVLHACILTASAQAPMWRWKVPAGTKFAGYRAYDLGIDENRFAGIRRWDDSRVLVYAVSGQTSLKRRDVDKSKTYLLHIYILNAQTSALESSFDLPVESASAELQVVKGGVVVRSERKVTFYSRQFKQIENAWVIPLAVAPLAWGVEGALKDWLKVFVSSDETKFVISCEAGRQQTYYLFDGESFCA